MRTSASNKHLNSIKSLNNTHDTVTSLEGKFEGMLYSKHSRTRLCNDLSSTRNLQYHSTRPFKNQTAMLISINKNPGMSLSSRQFQNEIESGTGLIN